MALSVPDPTSARPLAIVLVFLLVVLSIVGAILALNFTANPRNDFPYHISRPLVYNDVVIKSQLYEEFAPPPRTLVLGSSRAMDIRPADVNIAGYGSTFNWGLSSGSPGDALAIYRFAAGKQPPPSVLLYALEEDQLQSDRPTKRETRLSPQLGPYTEGTLGFKGYVGALARSLSRDYVWDSIRVYKHTIMGWPSTGIDFDPDGFWHYRAREQRAADDAFDLDAFVAAEMPKILERHGGMREPRPEQMAKVRALVAEARGNGTEVVIFTPPLYPPVRDAVTRVGFEEVHAATISELRSLCGPGVHVHDYTDVAAFDGQPDGFYDGWHYTPDNAARLVRALAEGRGDLCAPNVE